MKKIRYILFVMLVLLCAFGFSNKVYAYDGPDGWDTTYMTKDSEGKLIYNTYLSKTDGSVTDRIDLRLYVQNAVNNGINTATFTSSNPKVAQLEKDSLNVFNPWGPSIYCVPYVKILSCGFSTITAQLGDEKYEFTIIVTPFTATKIKSIRTNDYKSIKLTWEKVSCASGYVIVRTKRNGSTFQVVKQINSKDTVSSVISVPYNMEYAYCVIPKIKVGNKEYYKIGSVSEADYWNKMVYYKLVYTGAKITKLTAGSSKVTLNWATDSDIKQYKIYRKKNLNASWKLVYTGKKAKVGNCTVKQDAGTSYIYKIDYVFPKYTVSTSERSCYVVKKASTKKKAISIKMDQDPQGGQYGELNSANRDHTFYYEKGKKLHVVCLKEPNQKDYKYDTLFDYTLDSSGKVKSKKTVKLGKFDNWGGFYYGTDGYIYVVVGYYNYKESKTKTVIKVHKYSSSWKLQKTCSIKGKEGNVFTGITVPFSSGNCRMDMKGSKLYIITSRTMFEIDGINHQSNISFTIDTKTMKYKMANEDYTSHSFNQFVKFDANNLYLSNHGDAYDRAVNITKVENYGKKNSEIKRVLPFKIKGKTGYNYTGLNEGDMQLTADNILIAGTSVPQNYKVAGVTGNKESYAKNVFLTITNKKTLKSQRKWLTTYNPKTTKVKVGEVRMVKLSDDYVVLMYTTTKKSKDTLHYVVLNNDGKVVYSKTYSNMEFTASSKPILYNGAINWVDVKYTYKKENWYGMTIWEAHGKNYFYRIPAVTKK